MTITNLDKPTQGTMTQADRVVSYETWNSNITTWNTETRTWDEMGATMTNTPKVTSVITNLDKPA
jgi:hypothetical protein